MVKPAIMTKRTTARLRTVKMLLNLEDSWTPILRTTANSRVMENAVQSTVQLVGTVYNTVVPSTVQ